MKFLASQLATFLSERQAQQNVRALLKYLAFLVAIILLYAVLFHVIKANVEGERHSWVTGVYWTLTVMSTLGFGDITFQSDIGRVFSIVVLMSGIVLLLIVLPFVFIRHFYAPWLEAPVRLQAPRRVPPETSGHVLICAWDTIAPGLVERLEQRGIPYFVLEGDVARAATLRGEGISVIAGELESCATYQAAQVNRARLVLANCADTTNTNITLTVREVAPEVPIVAVVEDEDSIDILELSGASHVLPLKQRLGEHLANRINAGHAQARIVGRYHDLIIAEFTVRNTPLVGKSIRDTKLREVFGISVVAVWERGRLLPTTPDTPLSNSSVPIAVGTEAQMEKLDELLVIYDTNYNPVLVIGGGKVGSATAHALRRAEIKVHIIDHDESLRGPLAAVADRVFIGDAADRTVLEHAGLAEAPAVLLTTNDDAMNIYLAVYCRRLNPDLRIVSRITRERNLEAIHRAGADFVLSYASLGVETIYSSLVGRESVVLGETLDLFHLPVPPSLSGQTLAESGIGARTGLNVIAIRNNGHVTTNIAPTHLLESGSELVVIGDVRQRHAFSEAFGRAR